MVGKYKRCLQWNTQWGSPGRGWHGLRLGGTSTFCMAGAAVDVDTVGLEPTFSLFLKSTDCRWKQVLQCTSALGLVLAGDLQEGQPLQVAWCGSVTIDQSGDSRGCWPGGLWWRHQDVHGQSWFCYLLKGDCANCLLLQGLTDKSRENLLLSCREEGELSVKHVTQVLEQACAHKRDLLSSPFMSAHNFSTVPKHLTAHTTLHRFPLWSWYHPDGRPKYLGYIFKSFLCL
jgi:hypothetical protein